VGLLYLSFSATRAQAKVKNQQHEKLLLFQLKLSLMMSLSTNQPQSTSTLSTSSIRMLELRDEVLNTWEQKVRAVLPEANALRQPILIDTLPAFYDNIAESLTFGYPRNSGTEGTTVVAEHGGERARLTGYDHGDLIKEYQIFRWAIFEISQRESVPLDRIQIHAINESLDDAIQEAIEAFTLVHSGLRERFAAALTHDLRGPLSAVSMALELMLLLNDPTKIKTTAVKALTNIQRMSSMVEELLDTMAFHGGQRMQIELSNFDVNEIVKEVQADAVATHGNRFCLDVRSVNGWWDRAALKRALENLVSNAVKYGKERSPITIKVNETHGRLLLWVHNDGAPIPPEEQECIFQMYRRAEAARDSSKQGWGIGLPYVRAVAESHAGSVALDSSVELGTTFIIDIPIDVRPYGQSPTLA
jgi:signal transduction histidine kinase